MHDTKLMFQNDIKAKKQRKVQEKIENRAFDEEERVTD